MFKATFLLFSILLVIIPLAHGGPSFSSSTHPALKNNMQTKNCKHVMSCIEKRKKVCGLAFDRMEKVYIAKILSGNGGDGGRGGTIKIIINDQILSPSYFIYNVQGGRPGKPGTPGRGYSNPDDNDGMPGKKGSDGAIIIIKNSNQKSTQK